MPLESVPTLYETLVRLQAAVNRLQELATYIDGELVPRLDDWIDEQLGADATSEHFRDEFWRCAVAKQ